MTLPSIQNCIQRNAGLIFFTGALAYVIHKLYTNRPCKKQQNSNKKKYVKVGHLKSIDFYPFKGCQTVQLDEAILSPIGLKTSDNTLLDRSFMIYRPDTNSMVSPKYIACLSLIKVDQILGKNKMVLKINPKKEFFGDNQLGNVDNFEKLMNFPELILEPEYDHMYRNVNICGVPASVLDCGEKASYWITKFISENGNDKTDRNGSETDSNDQKIEYRIVHFDPENECLRDTTEAMSNNLSKIGKDLPTDINYLTPLTDDAPYSLVTDQSIQHVRNEIEKDSENTKNGKLNEKAFRINLIVDHFDKNSRFEEDLWNEICFGDDDPNTCISNSNNHFVLKFYYKLQRCFFTTVEPNNGKHRPDNQPLVWLNENRRIPENEVAAYGGGIRNSLSNCYGQKIGSVEAKKIRVGDAVWAKYK